MASCLEVIIMEAVLVGALIVLAYAVYDTYKPFFMAVKNRGRK